MPRNYVWTFFIGLILLGVFGYTAHTLIKVWQYIRLDQQTEAQNIEWSITSLSEEAYIPTAHYLFNVHGQSYQGEGRWQESYLNPWAAQEAINRLQQVPPSIWFDSSSPEISALQKFFPLKESIYTALLCLLALYFIGLGYYVNKRLL